MDEERYVERLVDTGADALDLSIDGAAYRLTLPADLGDVAFLDVTEGLPGNAQPVTVVCVRRRGLAERLRAALGGSSRRVVQEDVVARPA